MTLLVATIDRSGVQLVADTRITRQYDPSNVSDVLTGALKAIVLHPNLAVGFAGDDADAATDVIIGLPVSAGAPVDVDQVVALLARRSSSAHVEFLVAVASPPSLTVVANGRAWSGQDSEHIGQGFDLYQRYFHSRENAKMVEDTPSRMLRAMIRVVADGSCRAVGGSAVAVRTTALGFNYFGGQGTVFGPARASIDPTTRRIEIETVVGAPQGSYTETVLVPSQGGVAALAVHLGEIRCGALLAPKLLGSRTPLVFRDCTAVQLRDQVAIDCGINLVVPDGDLAVYF